MTTYLTNTASGEAQVDFGKAMFYENDTAINGHYLSLSFPYSNAAYTQVFKGENQECLLEGLKTIFEYMGKVPYKIWFDNLSAAVVLGKNKTRSLVKQFEHFSLHYGFEATFCNPNSGHEKGHVENKIGYVRRNMFVPIPRFTSLEDYNKELLLKSDSDMDRKHYVKDVKISDLFEKDKKQMINLPNKTFDVGRIINVKANKYGKVEFETNIYSTSPVYSGEQLILRVTANKVIVMNKDFKEIIIHKRIYGKNKESMKWHPYLKTLAKRPNAIKYTDFYNILPDIWKNYIEKQDTDGKKGAIKALDKMIEEGNSESIAIATNALKETMNNGVFDIDSVMTTYYRIKNPQAKEINDINIANHIPRLKGYKTDINIYDSFFERKVR